MAPGLQKLAETDNGGAADAVILHPDDSVATVLRAVAAGEALRVRTGAQVTRLVAAEPIPFCHKISLRAIRAGAEVSKYGTAIGRATGDIPAGAHVHVHNLRSARAQAGGDTG